MKRIDTANTVDLVDGVSDVMKRYSQYVLECKDQRNLISWEVVVFHQM
jgi:hypothetical protein